MDELTSKHLDNWLKEEFTEYVLEKANIRARMVAVYEQDPEFWGNQSWWNVYDAAHISQYDIMSSL